MQTELGHRREQQQQSGVVTRICAASGQPPRVPALTGCSRAGGRGGPRRGGQPGQAGVVEDAPYRLRRDRRARGGQRLGDLVDAAVLGLHRQHLVAERAGGFARPFGPGLVSVKGSSLPVRSRVAI